MKQYHSRVVVHDVRVTICRVPIIEYQHTVNVVDSLGNLRSVRPQIIDQMPSLATDHDMRAQACDLLLE